VQTPNVHHFAFCILHFVIALCSLFFVNRSVGESAQGQAAIMPKNCPCWKIGAGFFEDFLRAWAC
jgi:hypothetical protein